MTAGRGARARRSIDAAAVKNAVDLVALIERDRPLKRRGRSMIGLCPFHAENTPSFTVDPDKQLWRCFGCGKGGDVFSFVMERDGLDFRMALAVLAEHSGIAVEGARTQHRLCNVHRSVRIEPPPPDLSPVVDAALADTPAEWYAAQAAALDLPERDGVAALRRLRAHQAHYDLARILSASPRDEAAAVKVRTQTDWLRAGVWVGYPMSAAGRVVGVRLRRTSTADKRALLGGREGLFVPLDLPTCIERLTIVEGPTDCAALLALGFTAIGRPSCSGGVDHVRDLVRLLRPLAVVIIADRDEPGQRGASSLATLLALHVGDVRIVTPPAKDARAWVAAGARRADVEALIEATPRLALRVRAGGADE